MNPKLKTFVFLGGVVAVVFLGLTINYFNTSRFQEPVLASGVVSVKPVEDTYVMSSAAGTNYGKSDKLRVGNYNGTSMRRSLLKFKVVGVPNGVSVTNVKLRLYVSDPAPSAGQVMLVNGSWGELTTTWNNAPAVGQQIYDFAGKADERSWEEANVTPVVTGNGEYNFYLVSSNYDSADYSSREATNGNYPTLVLTWSGSSIVTPTPFPKPLTSPTPTPRPKATASPGSTSRPQASPTPKPLTSPTSRPLASATPIPIPSITPPSTSSKGIWISPAEIAQLPISGQGSCTSGTLCYEAWNSIMSTAQPSTCSNTPNMDVYDGKFHARCVYKTALAAVRLRSEPGRISEAQRYYDKTVAEMKRVMGTEKESVPKPDGSGGQNDGSLAIARNWPQYLISGDILGLYPDGNPNSFATVWGNYVNYMYRTRFTFRVGDGGSSFNSRPRPSCASNGCIMGAQAATMTSAYLGDRDMLDGDWLQFQRYTGNQTVGNPISFSSTGDAWYHNLNAKSPVNPKGSFCANGTYPADGAIPNDQGRGGSCPSNPNTAPGYTQYPWQGMQGAYAQAMVLDRLGYKDSQGRDPWQTNDQALLRTAQYQWYLQNKFGGSWYTSGTDAHWVRHLAFIVYNFKPISYKAYGLSENMDLTSWTHSK